jgi:hypothetical protein
MITKESIASMGMILPFQARVKASLHEVRRNCHCCDNHCCCRRTAAISTKILVQYLKVCTSVTLQTIRHNREPSLSRDLMPLYLLDDINNKAVAFVRFVVHDKTARSGQSKMAKQTSLWHRQAAKSSENCGCWNLRACLRELSDKEPEPVVFRDMLTFQEGSLPLFFV